LNERYVIAEQAVDQRKSVGKVFSEHSLIVDQMRSAHQPVILADIQGDVRFQGWPDMETVRGWLGAPLSVGGDMVGFLSLGSLAAGSFSQEDGERLQAFADQVAHVLERAWLSEQSQRRAEELACLRSRSRWARLKAAKIPSLRS
jgi:GAF domain-containing protein